MVKERFLELVPFCGHPIYLSLLAVNQLRYRPHSKASKPNGHDKCERGIRALLVKVFKNSVQCLVEETIEVTRS